jgi:DNA-binding NarL/FixJ family response regulator
METQTLVAFETSELRLVEGLAQGHQAKFLAAEFGVSPSALSYRMRRMVQRLGLGSTYALLKSAAASRPARPLPVGGLTATEREVLHAVRAGLSNAQIGQARGRSPRTIANQVASILRKTGAAGRRALVVGVLSEAWGPSAEASPWGAGAQSLRSTGVTASPAP